MIRKINDTFNDGKSTADLFWDKTNTMFFYRSFRKNIDVPKDFILNINDAKKVIERYKLRGFQFGNWLTTEDRYNYIAALFISLYDLNKVLRFPNNNLGLNASLGIALGSRGVPNALAHFEPKNEVINISRYIREDVLKKALENSGVEVPEHIPKNIRFINSGGIGSFAHEYGHFLDLMFGTYTEQHEKYPFLTGPGKSVSKKRINYSSNQPMRILVEDIFQILFYGLNPNKSKSNFAYRLEATKNDYLQNRQEIFARCFEQYISHKLLYTYKINNDFMTKPKYKAKHYLSPKEMELIIPLFDKLISLMREKL
ncbi:MAG: hypothetical protein HYU67_04530 [Flavobacteriia bacterium]|nr:hypothetical protein [Flavobacteriia bacterium]